MVVAPKKLRTKVMTIESSDKPIMPAPMNARMVSSLDGPAGLDLVILLGYP